MRPAPPPAVSARPAAGGRTARDGAESPSRRVCGSWPRQRGSHRHRTEAPLRPRQRLRASVRPPFNMASGCGAPLHHRRQKNTRRLPAGGPRRLWQCPVDSGCRLVRGRPATGLSSGVRHPFLASAPTAQAKRPRWLAWARGGLSGWTSADAELAAPQSGDHLRSSAPHLFRQAAVLGAKDGEGINWLLRCRPGGRRFGLPLRKVSRQQGFDVGREIGDVRPAAIDKVRVQVQPDCPLWCRKVVTH